MNTANKIMRNYEALSWVHEEKLAIYNLIALQLQERERYNKLEVTAKDHMHTYLQFPGLGFRPVALMTIRTNRTCHSLLATPRRKFKFTNLYISTAI